jgi:hypothetical protein
MTARQSTDQPAACDKCGQPMLPPGKRRESPDDYRHARGCPNASPAERRRTERLWRDWDTPAQPVHTEAKG